MKGRGIVVGILVLLLFTSFALGILSGNMNENFDMKNKSNYFGQVNEVLRMKYTTHSIIKINSNAEFATIASAEGWPGDGSSGNPYRIGDLEIDAQGNKSGIYIGNTTVHFILENCTVYNASYIWGVQYSGAAVYLNNVTNATLLNLTARDSEEGILLYMSNENEISQVNIVNNTHGLRFVSSEGNRVENVKAEQNYKGIDIDRDANHNILVNISAFHNYWGIHLDENEKNSIENITIENSTEYGLYLSNGAKFNNIANASISGTGDYGIYLFWAYQNNFTHIMSFENDYGLRIVGSSGSYGNPDAMRCRFNRFVDFISTLNHQGIYMDHVENNTFEGINVSSDRYGADLWNINYNIFRNVSVWNTTYYGIYLDSDDYGNGHDNLFFNLTVKNSNKGVYASGQSRTKIEDSLIFGEIKFQFGDNNTIANTSVHGRIYLDSHEYGKIENTKIYNESILIEGDFQDFTTQSIVNSTVNGRPVRYFKNLDMQGINIPQNTGEIIGGNVSNMKIEGINFSNAGLAILVGYSDNVDISEVNVSEMIDYGIYETNCRNISISNTYISTRDNGGLYLYKPENFYIENVTTQGNHMGISIKYAKHGVIKNSTVLNNSWDGLYLYYGENITVENIMAKGNHYGLDISNGKNAMIRGITAVDNYYAVRIGGNNNTIADSLVYNNTYGVYFFGGAQHKMQNVTVRDNRHTGVEISSVSEFFGTQIHSYNNSRYGIWIEGNNNVVEESEIHENKEYGIYISKGQGNRIANSTLWENGGAGIDVENSNGNILLNNNISGSDVGINIKGSTGNTIDWNTMTHGGLILYRDFATFTEQNIGDNNTVNGRKIYYFHNANLNNFSVATDAGEVIGGNVSWLLVSNLNLSDGSVGVEMAYSSHIKVDGCDINGNFWNGIYFKNVDNSSISNSSVNKNRQIDIDDSYYSGNGIMLYSSNDLIIENNEIMMNEEDGIKLEEWSNRNLIRGNTIAENYYGIAIEWDGGANNTIYNNSFYYNHYTEDTYTYFSQAYDEGENNIWYDENTNRGNYWHDWANNNDTNDQNNDGIVDWPYKISGGADAVDYYPLKNSSVNIPEMRFSMFSILVLLLLFGILRKRRKNFS